jgi:hypothetical protein
MDMENIQELEHPELSLPEALKKLLTEEDLSDLTLQGDDGSQIKVNRCLMAIRSAVFRRMLYGDFAEANQSIVKLGYSMDVLKALVQYIYTDSADILKSEAHDDGFVRTLLSLIDAATYFGLPGLGRKARDLGSSSIKENPVVWFAVCGSYGVTLTTSFEESALELIRANPKKLLEGEAIALLSESQMERILKDEKLEADEYTLFLILQAWTNTNEGEKIGGGIEPKEEASASRMRTAERMTKYISLESINPVDLSTTLTASGLVTNEQLSEAYKTQALSSQQQHGISYTKPRFQPAVWRKSNDSVLRVGATEYADCKNELLECQALSSGVYKWSILVEEFTTDCCDLSLGVASTAYETNEEDDRINELGYPLGWLEGGWAYGSKGSAYHNCTRLLPASADRMFQGGSKVTFTLDLTGEGTLSASVDGRPAFRLFDNMLSAFSDRECAGFVPAVSMDPHGLDGEIRVRFLGFE